MSRPLLEFGGGSGEILRDLLHLRSVSEAEALISGAEGRDQLRHISTRPFRRRNPLAASRTPAATQRSIIWPPRQRFTLRLTWRVLLIRLSAALVVASERWRRGERTRRVCGQSGRGASPRRGRRPVSGAVGAGAGAVFSGAFAGGR